MTIDWDRMRFIRVASLLRKAVINFPLVSDSETKVGEEWDERYERSVDNWDEADAIASEYREDTHLKGKHALLLDLDVDHVYVPSSTPYHGHLIITPPGGLEFNQMMEILELLQKRRILQSGFVEAARVRGRAWLRTPWTKKVN